MATQIRGCNAGSKRRLEGEITEFLSYIKCCCRFVLTFFIVSDVLAHSYLPPFSVLFRFDRPLFAMKAVARKFAIYLSAQMNLSVEIFMSEHEKGPHENKENMQARVKRPL